MKLKDQFRFVRQNLKKNKTRLFMTVLAAAMGCAFLIVLASVGFGLQKSIIDEITAERLLTEISVYGKEVDGEYRELTEVDLVYLESIDHVQTVTRRQEVQQPLKLTSDDRSAYVNSLVVHYPSEIESGLELFAGRMPGQDDEVIVGYHVYDLLQEDDLPDDGHDPQIGSDVGDASEATENEITDEERNSLLGKTVSLEVIKIDNDGEEEAHELTAKIVGMTTEPSREWMQDHNVLLSESLLEEIEAFTGTPLGSMYVEDDIQQSEHDQEAGTSGENDAANEQSDPERTYHEIQVYATSLEDVQQVAEAVRSAKYANHSVADEIDGINTVFYVLKAGLVFVGTIAVIIASIGIFNTMTMAVTERAQDIGIMKAVGANPRTIRRVFLLESCIIGGLGAVFGTLTAYGISQLVNAALPFIMARTLDTSVPVDFQFSSIPLYLTLFCAGLSIAVAVLSGMRPAAKATKVDVLQALRREV